MILLKDIVGQSNAVRCLSNSINAERVANSYLFLGPSGVGKAITAKAFLMNLMCLRRSELEACGQCNVCRRVNVLEHPDLLWIKPQKNKKIKIEEVRNIKKVLNLKPFESKINACVIEDAHMMTIEAQNALLKILEEPPDNSLFVLISSKRELLLPTITSRCLEVRFNFLKVEDAKRIIMEDYGDENGLDESSASLLAHLAEGSPGRAIEMIEEDLIARKNEIITFLDEVVAEQYSEGVSWISEDKEEILEDLELLIVLFRDIVMGKEGFHDMCLNKDIGNTEMCGYFEKFSLDKLNEIINQLISLRRALAGNVSGKLVSQVLPEIVLGK